MTRLLGPDGLPIRRQQLTEPQAEPELTGVRSVWTVPVASGLTPARLANLLRSTDEGHIHDFLVLAEEIEERELHYRTVLGVRRLAVAEMEVQVVAASEESRDIEIAGAVRELVARPQFNDLLEDLTDAIGKGFSVCEIAWTTAGGRWEPADYIWREPWFFQFDRRTGRELRLRSAHDVDGEELTPWRFVVHYPRLKTGRPWRGGLARLAVWAFMLKGFALKDWMAFLEVYGMPIRVGKYRPGATESEKRKLLQAVRDIAGDAAAIMPEGMSVEFVEANKSSSSDAYERKCRYIDEQVSKVVLGQTTTTDAISGGHAVAKEHQEVRKEIQQADARKLAATVQRDLIEPFVAFNFGLQAVYPKVVLAAPEQEDVKAFMESTERFVRMGGKVGMAFVRDKLGIEDPDDEEELLTQPASGSNGEAAPETDPPVQTATARALRRSAGRRHGSDAGDAIDELVEAIGVGEWEEIARPLAGPLLAAVDAATSFEDLLARLDEAGPDGTALARRLARMTAVARGLGDATDEP